MIRRGVRIRAEDIAGSNPRYPINLNALTLPSRGKELIFKYPKLDLPYKFNKEPSEMVRTFYIREEVTMTPLQLYRKLIEENTPENILYKKKEGKYTFLVGRDTYLVENSPLLLITHLWKDGAMIPYIIIGVSLLTLSTATAKFLKEKIIPELVKAGYKTVIHNSASWGPRPAMQYYNQKDTTNILLENIEDIYANGF